MDKYLSLILLALGTQCCLAQDVFFEKEVSLNNAYAEKRETFPVRNNSDGSLSIFLVDMFSVTGLLFDRDYNLIDEIGGRRPDGNYSDMLGCSYSDRIYHLFYSSSNHKTLTSVSYNYNDKTVTPNTVDISLKKQNFSAAVTHEGKFYLFTTVKGRSILKLYAFDDGTHYDTRTYEFDNKQFASSNLILTLDDALKSEVVTVDNLSPTAIDVTSRKSKLYVLGNSIVLTLDNRLSGTNVITFDLNTLESDLKFYKHATVDCGDTAPVSTNSYIHDNLLYQLKVCPSGMRMQVRDLDSGDVIHNLKADRDEEIAFRNTPVMQEKKALFDSERELSRTSQFLRKVSQGNAGLSVYSTPAGLELTIGGIQPIQGSIFVTNAALGSVTAIATPQGMVPLPLYNPTYFGYITYGATKSVYFKSRLDSGTFAHQPGELGLKGNPFDRIMVFVDGEKKRLSAQTVFRADGAYMLAYYIEGDDRFVIRVFE